MDTLKDDSPKSYSMEKQGELFDDTEVQHPKRAGYFFRRDVALGKKISFNLSYENFVLFIIAIIMLLVVFFSLGVEKGKRLHLKNNIGETTEIVRQPLEKKEPSKAKESKVISSATEKHNELPAIKNTEPKEIKEAIEAKEVKVSAVSAKQYTIQIVAYKSEKSAKDEMERLQKDGYDAFSIPSKEWFQICVGKYASMEEARKNIDVLKNKYPTCYIRNLK